MLHSVNIWCSRDAHEGRWIYLAARSRHPHLLSKMRWDPAGLGAGLAWVVSHTGSHVVSLRDAGMRLLHATRMRRKSLRDAGHHFVYRLSTYSGYRNLVATRSCIAQDRMRCLVLYTAMRTGKIDEGDRFLEPTHSARPTPMATRQVGGRWRVAGRSMTRCRSRRIVGTVRS